MPYDYDKLKDEDEDAVREFFERGGDAMSEEPWLSGIRAAHPQLGPRVLQLQAGSSVTMVEPLHAEEVGALSDAFASLAADIVTDSCRRALSYVLLHSLELLAAREGSDALMGAHATLMMAVTLSSAPSTRINFGSVWSSVLTPRGGGEPHASTAGVHGVLLLGFGGSSLSSMAVYEQLYMARWPRMVRLTHAGPLLLREGETEMRVDGLTSQALATAARARELPPTTAALDLIMQAVYDCEQLVVHCQSNQGHMIWAHLLQRHGAELKKRVVGMVYDCSAAQRSFFDVDAMGPDINLKSIMATLKGYEVGCATSYTAHAVGCATSYTGHARGSVLAETSCAVVIVPVGYPAVPLPVVSPSTVQSACTHAHACCARAHTHGPHARPHMLPANVLCPPLGSFSLSPARGASRVLVPCDRGDAINRIGCGATVARLPMPTQVKVTPSALEALGRGLHEQSKGARQTLASMLAASPEVFAYHAAQDPCVPALCLTSESDSVIRADGVRAFADGLRQAQPERVVWVTVMRGEHVMQIHTDHAKYGEEIASLLLKAGMQEG